MSRITRTIWIGDKNDAKDSTFMIENNITAILNVTPDVPNYFSHINYLRIPINDPGPIKKTDDVAKFYKYIPNIIDFIDYNENIFIHCRSGVQRAPSSLAAYFISKGMCVEETMRFIQKKRKKAFYFGTHSNFHLALKKFRTKLFNSCQIMDNQCARCNNCI